MYLSKDSCKASNILSTILCYIPHLHTVTDGLYLPVEKPRLHSQGANWWKDKEQPEGSWLANPCWAIGHLVFLCLLTHWEIDKLVRNCSSHLKARPPEQK